MAMLQFYEKNPSLYTFCGGSELLSYTSLMDILCSLERSEIHPSVKYFKKSSYVAFPSDQWDPITELVYKARKGKEVKNES